MRILGEHKCFGGMLKIVEHNSDVLDCDMKFSIYLPSQESDKKVPMLTFLSGLTCTHENFTTKAGAYEHAAQEGLAIIAPDTSPRGDNVPDDEESYDFGKGAGFYVNAVKEPWHQNYRMESYVTDELNGLAVSEFRVLQEKQGICGHSMGGHGALTLYLKYPDLYQSCSAFSPIAAPAQVPWGKKAFSGYLGEDMAEWQKHDATALMNEASDRGAYPEILIDQGKGDPFLKEQLRPDLFEKACEGAGQKLNLRLQDGYDHSYYFIQSFMGDHVRHHYQILKK